MMATVTIRGEESADFAATAHVNRAAFRSEDEPALVDRLRREGALVCSLVAEQAGQVVGHLAFSPAALAGCRAVAFGPLAVLPPFQRQGIGTQLTEAGIAWCRQAGYELIVLLGHPSYYPRFGFERSDQYGIGNDFGASAEHFMVLALVDGALARARGTVHYHAAFYPSSDG
jgi:putative acetyltransferase